MFSCGTWHKMCTKTWEPAGLYQMPFHGLWTDACFPDIKLSMLTTALWLACRACLVIEYKWYLKDLFSSTQKAETVTHHIQTAAWHSLKCLVSISLSVSFHTLKRSSKWKELICMHETRERHESDLITAILKMPLIERVIRLAYNPKPPPHQCSPCILLLFFFFFFLPLPNPPGFYNVKTCILPLAENRKECKRIRATM